MAEEGALDGTKASDSIGLSDFWPLITKPTKFLNSALHEAEKLAV